MAISETDRHRLYDWFEANMGPELAPTMIESLPPVNWTDVTTKSDLDMLRAELRGELAERFGHVDAQFGEVRAEIGQQTRLLMFGLVGSQATLVGMVLAVVHMFGTA